MNFHRLYIQEEEIFQIKTQNTEEKKTKKNYFKVTNVHNREELGRLYASMNNLEYCGSSRKNMKRNYKKLGNTICEMYKGFFKGDCFYGLMI